MIQSALLIALGFVGASFLALLIAPSVWRRAVYLTRKRIESSVPLTVNELQAGKDRLRAQHAMETRKIEIKLEEARQKLAMRDSEIGRLKDQVKTITEGARETNGNLAEVKRALGLATTSAEQYKSDLAHAHLQTETLRADLQTRGGELDSVKRMLSDAEKRLAYLAERFETVSTDLAKAREDVVTLKESRRDAQAKVRAAVTENNESKQLLKTERAKAKALEIKLERAVRQASDLEAKLGRREREFVRQQETRALQIGDVAEFENRAIAAEQDRDDLERELSGLTLRFNALEKKSGGKSTGVSTDALEIKLAQAQADAKALKVERDAALSAAAAAATMAAPVDDNDTGDDKLRDQMNQLAAEMVQLTSMLEGEESPINALIGDGKDADGNVISIADRVRLLRSQVNNAAE